jgi:hypothetical protein
LASLLEIVTLQMHRERVLSGNFPKVNASQKGKSLIKSQVEEACPQVSKIVNQ